MSNELPGLIVPIEARIDKLEKSLAKASSAQQKFARDIDRRSKANADAMAAHYVTAGQKISASFKSIVLPRLAGLGATVAAIGIGGATAAIRNTIRDIAEIGDEAKRSGLSAQAFQEWKFVADQNRIGIDALVDSFKELSLRTDEVVTTGGGAAAEAFKRLAFSASELKQKLEDPSKLMLEIIGRMNGMEKAAQIRIADELFGGSGGEKLVALLDRGAAGIQSQIDRARELGLVLDSDAIAKAAELDAKFAEVTTRLQSMWRAGVVGAGEFFGLIEDRKAALEETLSSVADDISGNVNAAVRALGDEVPNLIDLGADDLAIQLADVVSEMEHLAGQLDRGEIKADAFETAMSAATIKASDLLAEASRIDGVDLSNAVGAVGRLTGALASAISWAQSLNAELDNATAREPSTPAPDFERMGRGSQVPRSDSAPRTSERPRAPTIDIDRGIPDAPRGGGGNGGGGGGGGGGSSDAYASAVADLQRERLALDAEAVALIAAASAGTEYADAIELAHTRARLLEAAQRDGKTVTFEMTAEIDRLAQAHLEAGNAATKAADDLQRVEDAGRKGAESLAGLFGSVLDGSKSAGEALSELLLQLAQAQLQKGLMALFAGPLAGASGMLGNFFDGFAGGGYTGAGGTFEPAGIVHAGEYVVSQKAVKRIGVRNLEELHRGALKGYANGGLVGGAPMPSNVAGQAAPVSGPVVTINAPISVTGSSGTPEQNADLARQMADRTEKMFRGLILSELAQQMRPGGVLR